MAGKGQTRKGKKMQNTRITNEYKINVIDTDGFSFALHLWADSEAKAIREVLTDLERDNLQPKSLRVKLVAERVAVEMV
jgi:hypothetical protein